MAAERGQGRIRSNMRGPEGPTLVGGEQAQSLLDQLQCALRVGAGALGVDPRGIVEQSRRRRPVAEGFRGVLDGLAVAAQAGADEAPAVVGVAALGIELDGQLEVAQGQLRRVDDQVRPAPIRLHGRGRVQLERLGEILDGARILAQLGPGQAAAAIDRLERLARLQVAIERLDDFLETAQPEQGLRPQALRPANGPFAAPEPRRTRPAPRRTSRQLSNSRPRSTWSSTRYGLFVFSRSIAWSKSARARAGSLRSRWSRARRR